MNEKTQAAMDSLEQGLAALLASGDWAGYLKLQSQLHRYSFNNTLLIHMQCPQATQVMGYKQWQKVGRQVKKGEKGIVILAPCSYKQETEAGEAKTFLAGFRTTSVFDVSQTEGDELPSVCKGLQGDDAGLCDRLVEFAQSLGICVTFEPLFQGNGSCRFQDEKAVGISVDSGLAPLHRAKTLAHELAHALLHGAVDYRAHRPECELEAESTAFVVLHHFGLDSGDYSFGYVAGWKGEGAIAGLKKSGAAIQKAAATLIDAVSQGERGEGAIAA